MSVFDYNHGPRLKLRINTDLLFPHSQPDDSPAAPVFVELRYRLCGCKPAELEAIIRINHSLFETWTNRPHWDIVAHRTVLRAALSLHSTIHNPTPCVLALIDATERRARATATAAGPATGCAIHHRPPPACLPHHQTPPSAPRASVQLPCFFFFFCNKLHGKTFPAATRQTHARARAGLRTANRSARGAAVRSGSARGSSMRISPPPPPHPARRR